MSAQTTLGWAFRSSVSFDEMKRRLDSAGPQPWVVGDSAYHGDYLGGKLTPETFARIYEVQDGFVVNLRLFSAEGDPISQLAKATDDLLKRVLPLVEARDIRSTDPLE
jgi:hypothetical protein